MFSRKSELVVHKTKNILLQTNYFVFFDNIFRIIWILTNEQNQNSIMFKLFLMKEYTYEYIV